MVSANKVLVFKWLGGLSGLGVLDKFAMPPVGANGSFASAWIAGEFVAVSMGVDQRQQGRGPIAP